MNSLILKKLALSTLMVGTMLAAGFVTTNSAKADCTYAGQTFSCEKADEPPTPPSVENDNEAA